MGRVLFRAVLALIGGLAAAKLVELFLTSPRGQRLAEQAGMADLTTHRGVELAQKYARAAMGVVATSLIAIQETLEARAERGRRLDWPDRVQTYAQILLAIGSLAKTVSDFLEERHEIVGEGPTAA